TGEGIVTASIGAGQGFFGGLFSAHTMSGKKRVNTNHFIDSSCVLYNDFVRSQTFLYLCLAFLFTLLLRIALLIDIKAEVGCILHYCQGFDMFVFQEWGKEIAQGKILTSVWNSKFWSPIYAYIVGGLFYLFGAKNEVVSIFQLFLGSVMVFPI